MITKRTGHRLEMTWREKWTSRDLGIPQERKPKCWTWSCCPTSSPSLSSDHPNPSYRLDLGHIGFFLVFQMCQVCLIPPPPMSLYILFPVLEIPLFPHLYYPISTHLLGLRLNATSSKRHSLSPPVKTRSPTYILSWALHIFALSTAHNDTCRLHHSPLILCM